MNSLSEYLDELIKQRDNLAKNLNQKGVQVSNDAPFNTLVPKVLEVAGGGGIEKKLYSFGVLSDIHLRDTRFRNDSTNANIDYEKALKYYNENGVEFVCVAGDLCANNRPVDDSERVESQQEWIGELQLFEDMNNQHFTGKDVYAIAGNHDCTPNGHYGVNEGMQLIVTEYGDGTKTGEQVWKELIGTPLNFVIERNGDVFIFMSMYYWYYVNWCRQEDITWLSTQLEKYKDRRVFLFQHLPLPNTFNSPNDERTMGVLAAGQISRSNEFQELAVRYPNVIFFSGHTHYKLGLESQFENPNTYQKDDSMTMIHCSSGTYARNFVDGADVNEPNTAEGYIVDVYKDKVIINGVDFMKGDNGSFIPLAQYVVNMSQ